MNVHTNLPFGTDGTEPGMSAVLLSATGHMKVIPLPDAAWDDLLGVGGPMEAMTIRLPGVPDDMTMLFAVTPHATRRRNRAASALYGYGSALYGDILITPTSRSDCRIAGFPGVVPTDVINALLDACKQTQTQGAFGTVTVTIGTDGTLTVRPIGTVGDLPALLDAPTLVVRRVPGLEIVDMALVYNQTDTLSALNETATLLAATPIHGTAAVVQSDGAPLHTDTARDLSARLTSLHRRTSQQD